MKLIVIGRDPKQAEIVISNEYISNYHAEIIQLDNGDMFIVDKSMNGTFLNGSKLIPGKETAVRRGDNITFTALNIPLDWSMIPPLKTPDGVRQVKSIGSYYMNTIVVNGSGVSRFHATMREMNDGKWYICDHSKNGTSVNGKPLPKNKYVRIKAGDEISCAGIPVENPVKRRSNGWLYFGITLAAACAVVLVFFGVKLIRRPLSDEQIISMYDNSVGLMIYEYHYEVSCGTLPIDVLPDPDSWNSVLGDFTEPLYDKFIIEDGEPVSFDDANPIRGCGTGFFVGENGIIVTNRHVARPWEKEQVDYGTSIVTLEQYAADIFRDKLTDLYEKYNFTAALPYISQVEVHGVLDNMIIIPNGKFPTNALMCTEIACSSEAEDLALFRMLNDQMPYNVTPVPLNRIKPNEPKKGARILTIGFPMGLELLDDTDKTEIQAHTSSGSISRNDNKYVFGFDAASRPGASGSPVFDEYGNLMGVLNSGYTNTQGFNFGVRSEYLYGLLRQAGIKK